MDSLFRKHIALPGDHGAWVFLLSPLLIGLGAARQWNPAGVYLVVAVLAAFLLRQPVTIAVKAYSGRRPRQELKAAFFWIGVYGALGLAGCLGLALAGFWYLLMLVFPVVPVFAWRLYLVGRRAERRQAGVLILGSGALALSATAAYWVGKGSPEPVGWWLFLLSWFQSAASIVYAYLRLDQSAWKAVPGKAEALRAGRQALLYTSFNLAAVLLLSALRLLPALLPLPYLLQWAETLWGSLHPAIGEKPTRIGMRQLLVSTLFTLLFIITWKI